MRYLDYELWLGYTLSRTGDAEQGLLHVINVVEEVESKKLDKKLPYSTLLLAFAYRNANQFEKADMYFKKCIEASLMVSDSSHIHTALHELGNICMIRKDYKQTLAFHKQALTLREKMNKKTSLLYSYHDIAQDYAYLDSIDLALEYFSKAEQRAIELNDQKIVNNFLILCSINWG